MMMIFWQKQQRDAAVDADDLTWIQLKEDRAQIDGQCWKKRAVDDEEDDEDDVDDEDDERNTAALSPEPVPECQQGRQFFSTCCVSNNINRKRSRIHGTQSQLMRPERVTADGRSTTGIRTGHWRQPDEHPYLCLNRLLTLYSSA